jgi:exodeoxyribonuclease V gamma subunit
VQVHSCHGRTRQVEVLRDAIGHLLAADPDLEPRDIVVLCPEVEQFAPLVHAVFGAEAVTEERAAGELPQLRVRIADRSLREANPLMEVVARVLELVDSRAEASRVLDLAARGPVRRRFRLDDDDLTQLERWADDVGVRWGFDGEHRAEHQLDGIVANTWRTGLDRLLVGVAVADQDLTTFGGVVPHDVEGEDVDRAGRLAELVARLQVSCHELGRPQPVADWCTAIRAAVERLTLVSDRDTWQRQQLERELLDVERAATDLDGAVSDVALELGEVRTLLGDRLKGRPSRANHRTGDLTVCTLVPMRSVPHKVVCLLGMDDAAFPRTTQADGDSLIDLEPRVGDRDPRTEDRQLLLDAALSARDALVVTYTGHDERTNEPGPPPGGRGGRDAAGAV